MRKLLLRNLILVVALVCTAIIFSGKAEVFAATGGTTPAPDGTTPLVTANGIVLSSTEYVIQGNPTTTSSAVEGYTDVDSVGVTFYYIVVNNEAYISKYEYRGSSLITLTFPAAIIHGPSGEIYPVTGVADGVFRNAMYIQDVNFDKYMKSIGLECFAGCNNLSSISFPDSLKSIGTRAFYGCGKITSVSIPSAVNSIGDGAFAACEAMTMIGVDSGNSAYMAEDGVLYSKNGDWLMQFPAGKLNSSSIVTDFTVKKPVRLVCSQAFEGCKNLRTVTFEDSVTSIGDRAFYNCSALTVADIPDSVTKIGENAFKNCAPTFTFKYNKSTNTIIESYADSNNINSDVMCMVRFYDGATLLDTQMVKIGADATAPIVQSKVGYTLSWDKDYTNVRTNLEVYTNWLRNYVITFYDNESGMIMDEWTHYGGAVTPPEWTRDGFVLGWDSTDYMYVTSDKRINTVWLVSLTGQEIVEEKAYVGEGITLNSLRYIVTSVAEGNATATLVSCTDTTLKQVTVPDTITFKGQTFKVNVIGTSAMEGMTNLKSVYLGAYVERISKKAFYNCRKLSRVTINSKELKSTGLRAFSKTAVKISFYVPKGTAKRYRRYFVDSGASRAGYVYKI